MAPAVISSADVESLDHLLAQARRPRIEKKEENFAAPSQEQNVSRSRSASREPPSSPDKSHHSEGLNEEERAASPVKALPTIPSPAGGGKLSQPTSSPQRSALVKDQSRCVAAAVCKWRCAAAFQPAASAFSQVQESSKEERFRLSRKEEKTLKVSQSCASAEVSLRAPQALQVQVPTENPQVQVSLSSTEKEVALTQHTRAEEVQVSGQRQEVQEPLHRAEEEVQVRGQKQALQIPLHRSQTQVPLQGPRQAAGVPESFFRQARQMEERAEPLSSSHSS